MKFIRLLSVLFVFSILLDGCKQTTPPQDKKDAWTFVFMTDIHLEYGKNAVEGFEKALSMAGELKPEFILTGGDLVADALEQPFSKADSLYKLYDSVTSNISIPIYNTIGNHEILGWYNNSGIDRSHKEFGKKMFQNRVGKTYYSFTRNGWVFLILDSVEELEEGNGYYGRINDEQIEWLKAELAKIDKKTPIAVSTHIPFVTLQTQLTEGSTVANSKGLVIENSKDIFELFKDYNLQLVLQGHLHIFEDLTIYNTRFITGGAVSAAWWTGPFQGTEEGFLKLEISADSLLSVKYIDYGWNVETASDL